MSVVRPRGLIFDLGDTLMFIPKEFQLEARLAPLLGRSVAELTVLICQVYTLAPRQSVEDFVSRLCGHLRQEGFAGDEEQIRDICWESVRHARVQSDAVPALVELRRRGFQLALVSNTSPLSWPRIEGLGLSKYFDHVVFSCDVGYLKPDPRMFMYALKEMGAGPTEVCLIGDKIRTLILGGAVLGARLILVERRMDKTLMTEQIPTYAIIPGLDELTELPLLRQDGM